MEQNSYVPVKYVKTLLKSALDRGADVESILCAAGCSFNPLDPSHQEKTRISTLSYCRLLRHYAVLSRGHLFGLPVGENDATAGFRMMCFCIASCTNLREAIVRAAQFYGMYANPAWHFTLETGGGRATIRFSGKPSGVGKPITACDLSAWSRFWGWLTGVYIPLQEVKLVESRPDCPDKYSALFETDVSFGRAENAFSFCETYLGNPLVHNQESIEEFLSTVPYDLIALPGNRSASIASRVRQLIGRDFTRPFPRYEQVADMLHMSSTTLRRKLAREGTSYQQLKDRARRDAAISYLSNLKLSINAVSDLMGFVDPSSFNRTFKRWTGIPPGLYRDRYLSFSAKDAEAVH